MNKDWDERERKMSPIPEIIKAISHPKSILAIKSHLILDSC